MKYKGINAELGREYNLKEKDYFFNYKEKLWIKILRWFFIGIVCGIIFFMMILEVLLK